MAESVTVDHGGVSITSNTVSEADLRAEMEAPAESGQVAPSQDTPPEGETPAQAAQRARDEKGRFATKAAPEPTLEAEAAPEPEAQARRRDDHPRYSQHARMAQALAQKAEAERRAQALETELARYQQAMAARQPRDLSDPPTTHPGEPQFEQFANEADPYTAYLQAWTRWDRAQGIAQARAEWDAEQTQKSRAQTFQSRLTADKTHYPDFDQVLTQADTLGLQVSAVMQEAIADSPRAADLVYYLATHPEECIQLAERSVQTPVAAATVMQDLLESRLQSHSAPTAAPAKSGSGSAARATVSTAKPPVMPVGSSPVVSDEPPGDAASAAEHARYWNRRLKVPGTT